MDDHRRHLARGFHWLGGATIVARVFDVATTLAVLLFLTKQQVGMAAIVVSVGMVVEAFDGLGTGEALIQVPSLSRLQLDTLFWLVVGAAGVVGLSTLLTAPLIASFYGSPALAAYFLPIALKQPVVAAAVIPLAMLNRKLQYERIAAINVCASLGAASIRLGLAVAGAGVWAPVTGYAASGLFVLTGALIARPFAPRLRFRASAIRPLMRFGLRAAASDILQQTFKNIDFLLVGWFYGAARLAIYRVAFDLAMEPAMAVGTLINRTALPVFARVPANHLAEALGWSLRRIVILVVPLMGALFLVAGPLTAMIHDREGHSYASAAVPLKLLAAAGLLRMMAQLLYPLMMASGRPELAVRLSALTLLLLSLGVLAAGFTFHAQAGIIAVSAVWLCVYPIVLGWGLVTLERRLGIRAVNLAGLVLRVRQRTA